MWCRPWWGSGLLGAPVGVLQPRPQTHWPTGREPAGGVAGHGGQQQLVLATAKAGERVQADRVRAMAPVPRQAPGVGERKSAAHRPGFSALPAHRTVRGAVAAAVALSARLRARHRPDRRSARPRGHRPCPWRPPEQRPCRCLATTAWPSPRSGDRAALVQSVDHTCRWLSRRVLMGGPRCRSPEAPRESRHDRLPQQTRGSIARRKGSRYRLACPIGIHSRIQGREGSRSTPMVHWASPRS